MRIDLGALAKGYIADKLKEFLVEQGVQSGIIDLGGNILTIGENPTFHRPWRIGIQNPALDRGEHVAVIEISDGSVVTSGIYERQLVVDGKTYHHIFDRTTGYPMETELASITIVAKKSVDCEIWTTRLFGQNPYDIIEEIEQQSGLEAFVITKNQKMMYTSGIQFV